MFLFGEIGRWDEGNANLIAGAGCVEPEKLTRVGEADLVREDCDCVEDEKVEEEKVVEKDGDVAAKGDLAQPPPNRSDGETDRLNGLATGSTGPLDRLELAFIFLDFERTGV